ncbi:WGR domain-containing protein [Rhodanobacter denitrificans]|uniref:WGR domain-containing protein n=1 Tax=Rhodanobacter denitrificans TaxID=666685 RepID=UPI001F36BFEC|nr:WGR domain-containing protein [Rhodanobacter denitrificans]UJJ60407.1 WGR domain-containing protein [Rhodanobacter denitrificans]
MSNNAFQTRLECINGRSYKFYEITLEQSGTADDYKVFTCYGRIGTSGAASCKFEHLTLAQAEHERDKLVREKERKGYQLIRSGATPAPSSAVAPVAPAAPARPRLDVDLQLAAPSALDLDTLIEGRTYLMQEKHDGVRALLSGVSGVAILRNKRGRLLDVPAGVAAFAEAALTGNGETILDAELVGDRLFIFDLLMLNGEDMRGEGFRRRYATLEGLVLPHAEHVTLSPAFSFPTSKRANHDALLAAGAEGVVFKCGSAPYTGGRSAGDGDCLKVKFVESATVRVKAPHATKRSVAIEMLDGESWVDVGNVAIPVNRSIPAAGALCECVYLYAYRGGSLYQPVYKGERDDVSEADCGIGQLKFKAEARLAA